MFLTCVSPASLLEGSNRRIRIEYKLWSGSRLATHYSKALKRLTWQVNCLGTGQQAQFFYDDDEYARCSYCCDGVRLCLCVSAPLTGPFSSSRMILTGENRRTRRKVSPSASLSTTNPTLTALRANLGFSGEKPATKSLSYDTAVNVARTEHTETS
jgi:hypothetical protein